MSDGTHMLLRLDGPDLPETMPSLDLSNATGPRRASNLSRGGVVLPGMPLCPYCGGIGRRVSASETGPVDVLCPLCQGHRVIPRLARESVTFDTAALALARSLE